MTVRFDTSEPGSASYTVRLRNGAERCSTSGFTLLRELANIVWEMAESQPIEVPGYGSFTGEQLQRDYAARYPTTEGDAPVAWDRFHMAMLEAGLRRAGQEQYASAVATDISREQVSSDAIKALIWFDGYGPRLVAGEEGQSLPIDNVQLPEVFSLPRFGTVIQPPPGGQTESASCERITEAPMKGPTAVWETISPVFIAIFAIVTIGVVVGVGVMLVRSSQRPSDQT